MTPENPPHSALQHLVRRYSHRTQWLILAAGIASIIVLSLIARLAEPHRDPATATAPPPAPGTFRPSRDQWSTFKITDVKARTFSTQLITDGGITYDDEAATPVFSPYSGRVTRLIAKAGDIVNQGAPLMAVDATEFAQAKSDLGVAHAQLTLAEKNEQRQQALYQAKAGALKDWLQSKFDLAAAQNSLSAVRNRLHILGKTDAEIAALETGHARQQSAVSLVLAPISGTVTQRQVGLGQYISAGASTPVYTIGDLSRVWLIANAREGDAARIHAGETVDVHVLAYPGRTFNGRIDWVAPALDPSTHRLPVRAQVDNREGLLKPQMFATFNIRAGGESSAPAVPKSAVVYEGDEARVYVARQDGTIELRKIRIGRTDGELVEVTSGLTAGEKVVSAGTLFIDRALDAGA
jgi:cobalt-zinc-cadmium efflux system membrane fusion protein